jgi:hypothetical protein
MGNSIHNQMSGIFMFFVSCQAHARLGVHGAALDTKDIDQTL